MTNTAFTPGPWNVSPDWPFPDQNGQKHDAVVVKFGNEEALICSFEHSVMRDAQNANARLIAAAPELLAALEANLDRLEAWSDGERAMQRSAETRQDRHAAEGHWNTIKNYGALIEQARAAIAKATQ